jgi:hypothetical protein
MYTWPRSLFQHRTQCRRTHASEVVEQVASRIFPVGGIDKQQVRDLRKGIYEEINKTNMYPQGFRMEMGLWLCSELVGAAALKCVPPLHTEWTPVYDIDVSVGQLAAAADRDTDLWWNLFCVCDDREETFKELVNDVLVELHAEEDAVEVEQAGDQDEGSEGQGNRDKRRRVDGMD